MAYNLIRTDLAPSNMGPIHSEGLRMGSNRIQNIVGDGNLNLYPDNPFGRVLQTQRGY